MNESKTGAELIAAERQRQIEREGYTPEHDDKHYRGEIWKAAVCYCKTLYTSREGRLPDVSGAMPMPAWPWGYDDWKPGDDPISNLTKAGALIAAEIDRLQRLKAKGV